MVMGLPGVGADGHFVAHQPPAEDAHAGAGNRLAAIVDDLSAHRGAPSER